ncbi:MAG: hypothetical protein KDI56_16615, partial [Xanthomonadales bacterium]|nr:hypothetical protein [Xanthomonadales bacterium]
MTTATQGGLTIDGYSQPGASANTLAVPAGTNAQLRIEIAGSELTMQAPITLRGIAFGGPLSIERIGGFCCGTDPGSGRYEIEGNYFGLRADGLTPSAVPGILLHISTSSGNVDGVRIGGELPAQRNVFGSNGGATTSTECLRLTGTHHQVHGNLIGTDRSGMLALGCTTGILLQGQAIDIGGSGSAQGNLFAGHHDRAISISGTQTAGTVKAVIQGNRFGVAVDGSTPLPIGTRNVNSNDLPMIRGDNTASVVRIGGSTPAAANLFAHAGLGRPPLPSTPPYVQTAVSGLPGRWEILGNRYRGNRGAGIDTTNAGSGRRPTDVGDSDSATRSKLQNFPVISAFRRNGDAIEVDYLVDSSFAAVPGAGQSTYPLRIEFYAADGAAGAELLGV